MNRELLRPKTANFTFPAWLATWCSATYGVIQGGWIILGGPARWGGPAYSVLRQLPGSPYSWGIVAVLCGLLIGYGMSRHRWVWKAAGLLGLSIWATAFAIGAIGATLTHKEVGTTGGATYLFVALLVAILIWYRE